MLTADPRNSRLSITSPQRLFRRTIRSRGAYHVRCRRQQSRRPHRHDDDRRRRRHRRRMGLGIPGHSRRAGGVRACRARRQCASPSPPSRRRSFWRSRGPALPSWSEAWRFAFGGIVFVGLYTVLLNFGELTVSAGPASFIINANPIFTAVLAMLFLGERLSRLAWLGTIISFAGMGLIAFGEGEGFALDQGALLILGAALCTASASIVQKPLFARHKPLTVSAWNMVIGALVLSPFLPSALEQAAVGEPGGPRRRHLSRHHPEPRRLWQLGRGVVAPAGIARHQLPVLRAAGRHPDRLCLARRGADGGQRRRRPAGAWRRDHRQSEASSRALTHFRREWICPSTRCANPTRYPRPGSSGLTSRSTSRRIAGPISAGVAAFDPMP